MAGWEPYFASTVVVIVFLLLALTRLSFELVLVGGLTVLLVSGVLEPLEALAGFANEGIVTIGALYIVAAGVRGTGGLAWVAWLVLVRPQSTRVAIGRLMLPAAGMSAFMNNTPLVAMLIPAVADWARQLQISVSKLLIPLSYAAIMGGTCTLIGTSTNLVVDDMLARSGTGLPRMGMFDITWVGLPAMLIGCAYLFFLGPKLLPERRPARSEFSNPREYSIEMLVAGDSPLVGRTIEQAGLRHLPGAFLAEIDRDGIVLPAVSPQELLRAGDRLIFVGVVESMVDLQKIRGLVPATDEVFKLEAPRSTRSMIEAVVSSTAPIIGKTIRDARFRSHYKAVVVAVARSGQRIDKKIGDIILQPGDTLLLEAHPSFVDEQRNNRDFFLVSRLEDSNPPDHDRALLAFAIVLAMVLGRVALGVPMINCALVAAFMMMLTACCTADVARRSIDWQVILAIAAAVGLGAALEKTGVAAQVAAAVTGIAGDNPYIALAAIYLLTMLATEFITNIAAAALIFPMAMQTAAGLNANEMPFVITIMMAASASFATPIGYQTNLMVYGPGGYRFSDYARIGLPLGLLIGAVSVVLAPLVWGF